MSGCNPKILAHSRISTASLKTSLKAYLSCSFGLYFCEYLFLCASLRLMAVLGQSKGDITASSQFLYLHNTSTEEPQPGAAHIKWSIPTRKLRSTSSATRNIKTNERYADNVTYDRISLSVIVLSKNADNTSESFGERLKCPRNISSRLKTSSKWNRRAREV